MNSISRQSVYTPAVSSVIQISGSTAEDSVEYRGVHLKASVPGEHGAKGIKHNHCCILDHMNPTRKFFHMRMSFTALPRHRRNTYSPRFGRRRSIQEASRSYQAM